MPSFRLNLDRPPDPLIASDEIDFYWTDDESSSFVSTYGPELSELGGVQTANIDFLRLAVTVYGADRSTSRDFGQSNWNSRNIAIDVPLINPDPWRCVREELERLIGFLTGDTWTIEFTNSHLPSDTQGGFDSEISRVVLLSGGADSAIGALFSKQMIADGYHTLVSHVGATSISPIQRRVAANIQSMVPNGTQHHLQVNFRRKSNQFGGAPFANEPSSRSRSLMFIAWGLAVASRARVPLWIPENGFASLNPPLSPDRRGSLSTRTTHPVFIQGLTDVLSNVGAHNPIENPFVNLTKGEMFEKVARTFGIEKASCFLSQTHSCAQTGQRRHGYSVVQPCGVCYGCVLRKASFNSAGIPDQTQYIDADSNEAVARWLQRVSVETAMHDFIQRGIRMRDVAAMSLPPGYSAREAFDMCQRGWNELKDFDW